MTNEIRKDELLTEEQLDNVAGGTNKETKGDMDYLYERFHILWPQDWDSAVGQLGQLYYDAGMRLDTSERKDNKYFLRTGNGHEVQIDRWEARKRLTDFLNRR